LGIGTCGSTSSSKYAARLDDMLALGNVAAGNIEVRLDVWLIGMKV